MSTGQVHAMGPLERWARLVLVTPRGELLGQLPPLPAGSPWWPEVGSVVRTARERHGIGVTILRLLGADRERMPGGLVTYLAQVSEPVACEPCALELVDHPLRQLYAKPGGPDADLAWAQRVLERHGLEPVAPPEQIRTWNLSSLWRIPLASASAWLKVVPPFFAHEGALIRALTPLGRVPPLLGHEGSRLLMAEIAGGDLYTASLEQRVIMIDMLVALQHACAPRTAELLDLGLPDFRAGALARDIAQALERTRPELGAADASVLDGFVTGLPERFAAVAACGLPDTLLHGDFHSGNVRGRGTELTLLDWGDAGIGHPLLDHAAFLGAAPEEQRPELRRHWEAQWQRLEPGSSPARAWSLLEPVAAARQAAIYLKFLDHIEPAEHPYHRHDPAEWLSRSADLVRAEARGRVAERPAHPGAAGDDGAEPWSA